MTYLLLHSALTSLQLVLTFDIRNGDRNSLPSFYILFIRNEDHVKKSRHISANQTQLRGELPFDRDNEQRIGRFALRSIVISAKSTKHTKGAARALKSRLIFSF